MKILLCNTDFFNNKNFFIKWIEEIKDEIIVYYHENELFIRSSVCSHFGGEIYYDQNIKSLRCKWHDWKFCAKTGECTTHKILGKLNAYDFELEPNKLKNYKYKINNKNIYLINQ